MIEKRGQILIVDDEDIIRALLCQKLSLESHQCQEAINAVQALEKLASSPIHLVILDIKMPDKSGIELLSEIKARYPDTAVIMATALNNTHTAIRCMKQGAYDYLTKPFDLDEVVLSVNRALEKRRLELENRDYQQHLEQKVKEQSQNIHNAFFNTITALAYALEAKDSYTSGHSQKVTDISVALAKELGMLQNFIEQLKLAGVVHDIGKIGVKESVLNKPGKLTHKESQHMRSHPEIGEHILKPVVEDEEILKMVRHHHEHYDGGGYPDGTRGEQISLGARIVAVADAYDAMTSERPYRKAMGSEKACAEIKRCIGSQFDPEVVRALLKIRNS